MTFFTESDMGTIRPIANVVKLSGCDVPDWMMSLKRYVGLAVELTVELRSLVPHSTTVIFFVKLRIR